MPEKRKQIGTEPKTVESFRRAELILELKYGLLVGRTGPFVSANEAPEHPQIREAAIRLRVSTLSNNRIPTGLYH